MALVINKLAQLDLFDLIKSVLKTSSALSKLSDSDYYEYEPEFKDRGFNGLPLIVISVPDTDTLPTVLDRTNTIKEFTVDMMLKVDGSAQDKVRGYCNAIISSLESAQSTFEANGYYDLNIDLESSDKEFEKDKRIIVSLFTLTLRGQVQR